MATTITAGNATNGGAAVSADNTGILELKTGTGSGTTAITVNASQNVGIGTSSPASRLDVRTSAAEIGRFSSSATNGGYQIFYPDNLITPVYVGSLKAILATGNATDFAIVGTGANNMVFGTNSAERARITSGGEVYIAGTTDQGAYNLQCNGTGVWGAGAYVNGSDERIKEDIAPITSGLNVVTKLNPVTYRYKEDWSKDQSIQTGFIAQELLVAMEGQNYVDGVVQQGGSEGYYSVAYQNIIPLLTKAIQELKAELDATKAEIAALKGAA